MAQRICDRSNNLWSNIVFCMKDIVVKISFYILLVAMIATGIAAYAI